MSQNKIIKTGLASYGLSGLAFHAPFIDSHEGFELSAVLERTKNKAVNTYPTIKTVKTFEELLTDKEIDLIIVNTPTQLHFKMAKQALENGKHVVLEKPMTVKYAEAEELVQLASRKDLILSVFHNRRFESGFKAIKKLVDENTLGDPKFFKAHFNRDKKVIGTKKWKENNTPGAGIFYDLAPHLLDQALQLFGTPHKVEAKLEKQRPQTEVIDYFLITLTYDSGLKVELESSMFLHFEEEPKFIFKGSNGTYTKQLEDHQEYLLRQGIFPSRFDPDKGKIVWNDGTSMQVRNEKGGYKEFYEDLFEVITNKKTPIIKNAEALEVMKIMEVILTNQNSSS